MALIHCPECHKEVSDQAEVCPHCGIRLKRKPFEDPYAFYEENSRYFEPLPKGKYIVGLVFGILSLILGPILFIISVAPLGTGGVSIALMALSFHLFAVGIFLILFSINRLRQR